MGPVLSEVEQRFLPMLNHRGERSLKLLSGDSLEKIPLGPD